MRNNTNNPIIKSLEDFDKVKGNKPFELIKIFRAGNDFYYNDKKEFIPLTKDTIITDHGKNSLSKIPKYKGFINEPNNINWNKSHNGCFNLYKQINWNTKEGNYDNIQKMLQHVFKGENFNMILTYLYVAYVYPKHPLPVIGLVGGKNTGKTKCMELILNMFSPNSTVIDSEDLTSQFNNHFLNKLIVGIDEKSTVGGNEMERLKKFATGGSQIMKTKFKTPTKIDCYLKFIMASNETEDMLKLESDNTRFWIVEVQKLKSDDFDILEKATKEIPAFFYYLVNDYTPIERASRLWLDPKTFQTEVAKKMQANARPLLVNAVIENLTNYFLENETKNEVYFTADQFISAFGRNERWNSSWFAKDIKKHLNKKSYAKRGNNPFHDIIIASYSGNTASVSNDIKQRRYYHFTKQEIYDLNVDFEPPEEKTEITNKEIEELFN